MIVTVYLNGMKFLIITEDIEQTSCEVEVIQSKFNAYWTCYQDSCQNYEEYSLIDFYQPAQLANLEFQSNTNYRIAFVRMKLLFRIKHPKYRSTGC